MKAGALLKFCSRSSGRNNVAWVGWPLCRRFEVVRLEVKWSGLVKCEVWGKGRKQRCLLGFGLEPWEEQNCHLLRRREGQEAQFPSGRGRFEMFIQHLPEMGYRHLDRWAGAGRRGSGWETQTQAWTPLDGIWSHGTRSDHQGGKRTSSPVPWGPAMCKNGKDRNPGNQTEVSQWGKWKRLGSINVV